MKVSDYIVKVLVDNRVEKVFGYIGGNNAHIFDSVDNHPKMEMVNAVHEQGAGFAAEGYARATETLGVATATSGPGATNLVTPIGSCFLDSIPTIFITGQVNRYEYKYDDPVRQIGFQETDIVSVVKPITKYTVFIDKVEDIRYELEKSCYLAQEGRKGPVLVDIPIDVQYQSFNPKEAKSFYKSDEYKTLQKNHKSIENNSINRVATLLNRAKKPLILVGGGARLSGVQSELLTLLNKTDIPVVTSLMGKDVINSDYKYNLGFVGVYGIANANLVLKNCDLLIILGSRLDARQTTRDVDGFIEEAKVVHVDLDRHEINRRITADIVIEGDVKEFVSKLNQKDIKTNIELWLKEVLESKKNHQFVKGVSIEEHEPNQIIHTISKYLKDDDIICVDVGLHQMWSAQSLDLKANQRILFSGGAGSMGFALPIAIGATIGTGKRAIVISGDGGFQMNLQELEVIKRRNLPIKIFIINNGILGMVRQMQTEYLDSNCIGTENDYSAPDFRNLARTYKFKGYEATGLDFIQKTIKLSLETNECNIVDVKINRADSSIVCLDGYSDTSDREEVDYSNLDKKDTMVILALGQANAANSAEGKYKPKHNVYNIFDGKCYKAIDPLLGATATTPEYQGSVWTRVADKIIESGIYKNVIIKSIAVAGTPISCWEVNGTGTGWGGAMHGSYHQRILDAQDELQEMGFDISHILFHQGETDTQNRTSTTEYKKSFLNMLNSMREYEIKAPIYVALASRYGFLTSEDVILAQKELIQEHDNILEGPNTDSLDRFEDRLSNGGANMTEIGVEKHATMWFEILKNQSKGL